MKQIRLLALFLFIVAASFTLAQQQSSTAAAAPESGAATVTPAAPASAVRILVPTAGQTLTSNFVDLRFELVQPAQSGEPNFLIQLDSQDPIDTSATEYTFSELLPGSHSIRVTLVDANKSPVQGGSAIVQFKVQPAHNISSRGARQRSLQTVSGAAPAAPIPPELRGDGDINLPLAGSPLPVLSLIGFGLLIGGAAHAMRKR
jgi:hypothetical protein